MSTRRTFLSTIGLAPLFAIPAVARPARTPDQRIADACEEIRQALTDKYGWRVNVVNQPVPYVRYVPGGPDEVVGYNRHVVLIDAAEEKYGPTEARWFSHWL